jgi:hypothetical protein
MAPSPFHITEGRNERLATANVRRVERVDADGIQLRRLSEDWSFISKMPGVDVILTSDGVVEWAKCRVSPRAVCITPDAAR